MLIGFVFEPITSSLSLERVCQHPKSLSTAKEFLFIVSLYLRLGSATPHVLLNDEICKLRCVLVEVTPKSFERAFDKNLIRADLHSNFFAYIINSYC